ncbi:MAG: tetratricopeptide repeat protein [Sandaracinaceae bacterium]|nr:tetratricopeptide repeat protein [Sandaracinaceae bacterium]
MKRFVLVLGLGVSVLCGCGASVQGGRTTPSVDAPATITDATFSAGVRAFHQMALDDEARGALRDRIVAYLVGQSGPILEAGDYRKVVEHFRSITEFYTPDDFTEHRLSPTLRGLASWIVEHGSPSGEEGEVLSAWLVLASIGDNAQAQQAYDQLAAWGVEVRANLPSVPERMNGLVEVWEIHARLTPATAVLDRLTQLIIERRAAFTRLLSPEGGRAFAGGMTLEEYRMANIALTRAPFDVAAAYLAEGDLASALSHVQEMGGAAATEAQLVRVIRDAQSDGNEADEALLTLARGFMEEELGRVDVALALCRLGQRRNPTDPRYPQCLGRIAAIEERYVDATVYYSDAIHLAPAERTLYDEALQVLSSLIDRYLSSEGADSLQMRTIAEEAEQILDERTRRFPDSQPPVAAEALHLVIGMSSMGSGDLEEARRHFEASVAARESTEALIQLGTLHLRMGDPAHAVEYYRRALDHTADHGAPRANTLELLGDGFQLAGNADQARRMYEQALGEWAQVTPEEPSDAALIDVHKFILLDQLGRHDEAAIALRRTLNAGVGQIAVYTIALCHLVTAATPDLPLAQDVYRTAQRQLSVPPEWKVYFALWVKTVAARAHATTDSDVDSTLHQMVGAAGWHGALAKFGAGQINFQALLGMATTRGQEAEANFYEATRLMAANDTAAARARLEAVLATHMVSFYEYGMSQLLLRSN